MKILIPALAAITLFAVGFVLVELHAPTTPAPATSTPPPPPIAPVVAAPPPRALPPPSPQPPTPNPEPPPTTDPQDVVVRGKTRREWHIYYAQRQKQIAIETLRYQAVIDRAIAGEEPDPRELGEAHDHVRELNARLKEDLEALQQIDGAP